jgi:hypothetical protein
MLDPLPLFIPQKAAISTKTNQLLADSGAFRSCFALFVNNITVSSFPKLSLSKRLGDQGLAEIVNDDRE